jgi:hypothetical protein
MKHLKILALAAVAAGALMAFIGAGTASASELCSTTTAAGTACPAGQKITTPLLFTLSSGTSALLKETTIEGGATLDTCEISSIGEEITNSGSSTTTVTGTITKLTWGGCSFPTTTTLRGKLEIYKIAGTSNGTVTSDTETKVTINTIFFGSCVYTVPAGESFGELTEGNPAVLHANAVIHKVAPSPLPCPTTGTWTATYTMAEPKTTVSVS